MTDIINIYKEHCAAIFSGKPLPPPASSSSCTPCFPFPATRNEKVSALPYRRKK